MDKDVVLSGKLHFLGVPELLQLLATSNSTGTLRLTNPYALEPASVIFLEGNIIHAVYGPANGLTALYPLFGWTTGRFEFTREKTASERTIRGNEIEIVLEGLRMLDEGLIKKMGPGWDEKSRFGKTSSPLRVPLIKKPVSHYIYMATEEEFSKGTKIVEEGEFGSWMWMVLDGTAEMSKMTHDGPAMILRVAEGAFVGNISSILTRGYRRIATFTATETIRLGVLDPQAIYREYSNLSDEFRRLILSLDNRFKELAERLPEIHSGIKPKKKTSYDPKKQIGRRKEIKSPFVILEGNATIISEIEGQNVPLIDLRRNDFFGPLPFLGMGQELKSESVIFSDDLKYAPLNPDSLQDEYDQLDNIIKSIIDFSLHCIFITTMKINQLYQKGKSSF